MVNKSLDHRTTPPGGLVGVIARTTLRVLQIIVALVVAGLYGDNLNKARKAGQKAESAFIYSEVVVGLSIITAIVYLLPILKSYKFFFWDTIIFIFWTALFGTFASRYLKTDCGANGGCKKMKVAVWFDLVGMLLWFISSALGGFMFWRERRSMFTGRAEVV